MDEYMFLTMAKLKADRLKLEREQHVALHVPALLSAPTAEVPTRDVHGVRSLLSKLEWREQS